MANARLVLACSLPLACSTPQLYPVCSSTDVLPTGARLGMSVVGEDGYTLAPVQSGAAQPVTLQLANGGVATATNVQVAIQFPSKGLSFLDGGYPGLGGTCGTALDAGDVCTVQMSALAGDAGSQTFAVTLSYFDGTLFQDAFLTLTNEVVTTPFVPAPHQATAPPPMPAHAGIVSSPLSLVTVSFSDTTGDDAISAFGDWAIGSNWLSAAAEYGVVAASHTHVQLAQPSPATLTDADVASEVVQWVHQGTLPGAPGAQSLYMLFPSASTVKSDVFGAAGWHASAQDGTARLRYAVVLPGCTGQMPLFSAAHELVEAATDPDQTGFFFDGHDTSHGDNDGEVADVCDGPLSEGGHSVPSFWSNAAAASLGNPCGPDAGIRFDVSVPSTNLLVSSPGASAAVTVVGWSPAPVGDWALSAEIYAADGGLPSFTAVVAPEQLNNGRSATVTVTAAAGAAVGESGTLWLRSKDATGNTGGIQVLSLQIEVP